VTEPGPYDDRQPAPRCPCGHPAATVDLYNGRRCYCCHPTYSPDVAAGLVARGWHDTAQAYARTCRQET
jgi:hypothetical protein